MGINIRGENTCLDHVPPSIKAGRGKPKDIAFFQFMHADLRSLSCSFAPIRAE